MSVLHSQVRSGGGREPRRRVQYVVNEDDQDSAGLSVNAAADLATNEDGKEITFTVQLDSQPTHDVTVAVTSSDTTEGIATTSELTFTPEDWDQPKQATVTGVNDHIDDDDVGYRITSIASSQESNYQGLAGAVVAVTNLDDHDMAGITVTPTSGLLTDEGGSTATFTVKLASAPTHAVTIALTSSDTTEGTVPESGLTFTPENWHQPQAVTVTGVDDADDDGDVSYTIVTAAATSNDPNYGNLDAEDVSVTNADDDVSMHLGRVDFRRLDSLTPGAEGLWFRLETAHDGWLTVLPTAEWTADQLTFELYDPADVATLLAVSSTSVATPRFDHTVQEGQIYLLRVTGTASDASLLLANLVHEAGGAVTVHGTGEADEFKFDAAASREVTINSVAYHYEDTQISTVGFAGGDGNETFTYLGADNSARVEGKRRDHLAMGFDSIMERLTERDRIASPFDVLDAIPMVRPNDPPVWEHYLRGLWLLGLRLEESMSVSWDQDAPIAVDLNGRRPKSRIDAVAEKGNTHRVSPMTPDFAEFLAQTPVDERTGPVFKLISPQTKDRISRKRALFGYHGDRPQSESGG